MMNSKKFGTLIGSFGKGVPGSVTVNFGVSGGENCDDSCPLKQTEICYAISAEKRKPSITKNLERKEADIVGYTSELASDRAIDKLNAAPWVRFSAFGSIPDPAKLSEQARDNLQHIADKLTNPNVHFPVETVEKASFLQSIGFFPRLSIATDIDRAESLLIRGFKLSAAVVGHKRAVGKNKRAHSEPAFQKAKELRAKGINAKVCPAIPGSAKCGDCKLCARRDVDLIIYPVH